MYLCIIFCVQIDLQTVHLITATETQGRFGNGQGAEFAENYKISYWRPELNNWIRYRDHTGNEVSRGRVAFLFSPSNSIHNHNVMLN